MTLRSWVRQLFARRPRTARKAPARCRPTLEALEDRALLDTGLVGGGLPYDNLQPSVALNYIIATQGVFPQPEGNSSGAGEEVLMGEVRLFAGDFAPGGWEFAEGQLLPINQNAALFSLLGTTYGGDGERRFALPDLRGRVPVQMGEGPGLTERELGEQFGVETVRLREWELPVHSHTTPGGTTGASGGGQPVENVQPSLGVNFIVALQGIPDYLGEVRLFAGNFAPDGWAFAEGQLLSITQNRELFERLGTTYGGNGFSTFALPDLRGRTPVQAGQGMGLTDLELGEQFGVETVRLREWELPVHSHTTPGGTTGASGGGQPLYNVQPSLGMNFIISMYGIFPSPDGSFFGSLPTIGEVRLFASDSLPSGWALADGSLIPISENETLFAILGTTYGGDGQETFALPDLRGHAVVHAGQGPGLTARTLGERFGAEIVTLTTDQIPAHGHTLPQPTVASNQAAVTVNEGSAASNSGTFDDPQGTGTVTLSASLGTVTKNDATGTWSWSHGPADGPSGPTVVTITATNTVGLTAATTFTLTVNNVAPTITISGDGRVNQGVPYELTLGALTDPGSDAVTQYIVRWGDGSSDTYTAAGTPTHVYTSAGTYLITVDLVDEDGTHTDRADPLSVVVNAAPTDLTLSHSSVEENQPPDTLVGTLSTTDPNSGDTFTYTLVGGEGDNALFRIDGNQLMTTARFDFEARSSYSIRVRSTDAGGLSVEKVFTIDVSNVNQAPTADAGGPYTVAEGGAVVLTGTGTDPDAGDPLSYAWDLDGDGTFETAGPNPTFSAAGLDGPADRTVTLRVTGAAGLSADSTATVTVANVPPTASITTTPAASREGRGITLDGAAADPGPDPLTLTWAVTRGDVQVAAGEGPSFSFTPDDDGVYRVTLTADDGDGGTGQDSTVVRVANVAPTLSLRGPQSWHVLRPYTLRLGASDPGADRIRRWVIRWGDGTVQAVRGNPRAVRHRFPLRTGRYTITATALDEDGRIGPPGSGPTWRSLTGTWPSSPTPSTP